MADNADKQPPRDQWGCGWEAQRLRQLTMGLAATPAQRLAWLEEMMRLAHRTGALPKPRGRT
ncbi:MAG: hypothetical protein HY699_12395 [Deltaproteobacteria bacterium]|nr:hypothetical protein [Deltaproteobacteria bacterium]